MARKYHVELKNDEVVFEAYLHEDDRLEIIETPAMEKLGVTNERLTRLNFLFDYMEFQGLKDFEIKRV